MGKINVDSKDNEKSITYKKGLHYYLSILLIAYPIFYPALDLFGHIGQYLLFGVWFFISIINKPNFIVKIIKNAGIYIGFYIIIFIKILSVWPNTPLNFYSPKRLITQLLIILVYYIFGLWHNEYSNNNIKKSLIKVFFVSYLISALISIYYLINNEYAIRRAFDYSYFAVGDFNLVYSGACIGIIVWILFINKRYNLATIMLFVITNILVIKASYMTAIALYILALMAHLIIRFKKTAIVLILITVIILGFGINYLPQLLLQMSESDMFTYAIQYRLKDIARMLTSQRISNSLTILARFNLASASWESFFSNPLLGIDYRNYNSNTIGHHIQWVDNLARFGIIGNFLLTIQLLGWFIQIFKSARDYISKLAVLSSWTFFFVLGMINNNILGGLLVCMFFVSNNITSILNETKGGERHWRKIN